MRAPINSHEIMRYEIIRGGPKGIEVAGLFSLLGLIFYHNIKFRLDCWPQYIALLVFIFLYSINVKQN